MCLAVDGELLARVCQDIDLSREAFLRILGTRGKVTVLEHDYKRYVGAQIGIPSFDLPTFLAAGGLIGLGAWPVLMGISMFLQQKLNPQPTDPMQARIFMLMPILFTFMLAQFSAGLVIYWTWNNLLSIAQQWVIMRRAGIKNPAAG